MIAIIFSICIISSVRQALLWVLYKYSFLVFPSTLKGRYYYLADITSLKLNKYCFNKWGSEWRDKDGCTIKRKFHMWASLILSYSLGFKPTDTMCLWSLLKLKQPVRVQGGQCHQGYFALWNRFLTQNCPQDAVPQVFWGKRGFSEIIQMTGDPVKPSHRGMHGCRGAGVFYNQGNSPKKRLLILQIYPPWL